MDALSLSDFMGNLRELPEFEGWTNDQFQALYANDYLPFMQQSMKQPEPKAGLINSQVGIDNFFPDTSQPTPYREQQPALRGAAQVYSAPNESASIHGSKDLRGRGWNAGLTYVKRF